MRKRLAYSIDKFLGYGKPEILFAKIFVIEIKFIKFFILPYKSKLTKCIITTTQVSKIYNNNNSNNRIAKDDK